jgi:hypothetical protein
VLIAVVIVSKLMKTDFYTKAILTTIAAALLILCAENVVLPRAALAQNAQKFTLVDGRGLELNLAGPSEYTCTTAGVCNRSAIPVVVMNK